MSASFPFSEKYLSQVPALQLLMGLGYQCLSPAEALRERGGSYANLLLADILRERLVALNRIHHKGREHPFSDASIQEAMRRLSHLPYEGLQKTSEAVYDLLTLGTALEQSVGGSQKSFTLRYIDWERPERNLFHVVPEFSVERSLSLDTARPDLALFVNGIPFGTIECKPPKVEVAQAVSQTIRNQGDEYIPRLFTYAQLVMGVNKNEARYATAGSAQKFWGTWEELEDKPEAVAALVNRPLSEAQKQQLFTGEFAAARRHFDQLESEGERQVTGQDRAIYSLCRPERLLDLAYRFILFEHGEKKIARYQQYFVVRSTLQRVRQQGKDGKRKGGIVWHTQGSGKSLTMVMLARNLAFDAGLASPRLLLVTDREDLDQQLGNTFKACGMGMKRAASGRNLVQHLRNKADIITTLIHKFDKGWASEKFVDESPDIFVLVDESHRTNFGSLAGRMRQMLPNACYLGFTGTPLMKQEKSSFQQFGGLIRPEYSVRQAVKDKAVLPLLYEGRHVEMQQDKAAIDLWFERHTAGLTQKQQADLKRKHARAEMLNKADRVIYMRAFDINAHYCAHWQRTGFKAQLVAPTKAAALRYQECLKEFGTVTAEVVISAPDSREGHEEVDAGPTDEVGKFWQRMMKRFGSEDEYTTQLIKRFKDGDEPEILIVVDKLLTGFDAPRNAVLYLCRTLREHTLLQAIARVNRLHEGKEFGYIVDYASVLGELDKALTLYDALAGFDEKDLAGTLVSVHEQVRQLPQRYSDLWDLFREVRNRRDEEAFEALLADDAIREEFYKRLAEFSNIMGIALSSQKFLMNTGEARLKEYKQDLRRFQSLRSAVRLRYGEAIEYSQYAPKIRKLLDTHIQANEVLALNEPVNIFSQAQFEAVKKGQGIYSQKSEAARADIIAHATKRLVNEKMEEDPAFYQKFSKLIQQAIDDFRAKRISDLDYLARACELAEQVVSRRHDDLPARVKDDDEASAYYGAIAPQFAASGLDASQQEAAAVETALAIQRILGERWKVDFWADADAQKQAEDRIDDFLYDGLKEQFGMSLSPGQQDEIISQTMQIARSRSRG